MRRYIRFVTAAACVVGAVATYETFPSLWDTSFVRTLGGIFAVVSMLLFAFFRRLETISGLDALTGRELQRFKVAKDGIRNRFWSGFIAASFTSAIIFLLAPGASSAQGAWYPTVVGLLFGINVGLALSVMAWIDELSAFSDELKLREQMQKNQEAAIKRLEDARKLADG